MTDHEDHYDELVERLRAMFNGALEEGELPAELLPENQDTSDVELGEDLENLIVNGDEAGLRALAEEGMLAGHLNRGEEEGEDDDLDQAREQLRRRRAEQEEDEGAPPPSPDAR